MYMYTYTCYMYIKKYDLLSSAVLLVLPLYLYTCTYTKSLCFIVKFPWDNWPK